MTETGRVRELKDKRVIIAPDRSASCFGCMNHECKSGGGFITAENPQNLPLQTGHMVEVKAPPGISLLGQAIAALLPPIAGFAAGLILARLFLPQAGEGAAAGIGVIFLFASAFIVYGIRKKHPPAKEFTVTRIIG